MTLAEGKALLHLAGRRRRVVDADDIYYGTGWEVRMAPPVNKVLPVSRCSLTALLEAYRPTAS